MTVRQATLEQFISYKTKKYDHYELYPLLAILRNYARNAVYAKTFKELQWQHLKEQLNDKILDLEISDD